jgi:hypothetical protein
VLTLPGLLTGLSRIFPARFVLVGYLLLDISVQTRFRPLRSSNQPDVAGTVIIVSYPTKRKKKLNLNLTGRDPTCNLRLSCSPALYVNFIVFNYSSYDANAWRGKHEVSVLRPLSLISGDRRCAIQVEEAGPELDLKMSVHRYQFLLSLVNAYCILGVMAQNLPRLSGRLALYTEIRRPCGRCRLTRSS